MNYTFKEIDEDDFEIFFKWICLDHVKTWWGEPKEKFLEKENFNKRLDSLSSYGYIASLDDNPFAFIQFYYASQVGDGWWEGFDDKTIGIDQFIGDPDLLYEGHGPKMIRSFLKKLKSEIIFNKVITDPDPKNHAAIKCYEKVGFQKRGEIETPDGLALLMEL